jgi:hypothetical protein
MTNISLPEGSYDAATLIAAIQESNDTENQQQNQALQAIIDQRDAAITTLEARLVELVSGTEDGNLLQAVLIRLAAVEAQLPLTRAGFGVTTTVENGYTCYRVQMLDQNGATQIVEFKLPITSSY